ncbi:hypothetical protein NE237_022714 [Protea cynaroides]|uniref:Uncharacterized protein n=1 Tax=Protea cynaroides TaxID=273540 RepID=A0A9Q0HBH5_9MAGN|nr:hypothetical protein NE237_022714 [Protea cynaroides]
MVPSSDISFPQWLVQVSNSSSIDHTVGHQVVSFASFLSLGVVACRNELNFQSKNSSPMEVKRRADKAFAEYRALWDVSSLQRVPTSPAHSLVRHPPPRNDLLSLRMQHLILTHIVEGWGLGFRRKRIRNGRKREIEVVGLMCIRKVVVLIVGANPEIKNAGNSKGSSNGDKNKDGERNDYNSFSGLPPRSSDFFRAW